MRWLTPRAASARQRRLERRGLARQHRRCAGALTAATESRSPDGCTGLRRPPRPERHRAMRPRPVASCMIRPRCQTTRTASSRASTPATCSAAISPTLWPTTAAGATPHDFHSAASATCSAKIAGCATSVSSSREPSSARAELLEQRPASQRCEAARRPRPAPRRKTGSSARSSRPIAYHCGPWPLNTKPTRGAVRRRACREPRPAPPSRSAAGELRGELLLRSPDDRQAAVVVRAPLRRGEARGPRRGIGLAAGSRSTRSASARSASGLARRERQESRAASGAARGRARQAAAPPRR